VGVRFIRVYELYGTPRVVTVTVTGDFSVN